MKYFCLFILIFAEKFLAAQDTLTEWSCKSIPEMEAVAWQRTHAKLESTALNNYNLIYQRCYWEIDPAVNYISGNIMSYFKPTVTGFSQIQFDLKDNMKVDSVIYHSSQVQFARLPGDLLQIVLPSTLQLNSQDSVTVYYGGQPKSDGFGSFVQSEHNGVPVLWTLSEPYGAKVWWPCKQNLVDKIDSIDIIVKVPQGNRVASNGVLLSEIVSGNDKLFHWRSRYPITTYLVALAVTNYTAYSDHVPLQTTTLQVLNYVYPESYNSAKAATHYIVDIIQFFDSLLVEYPFAKEKYGHAQFGWGGGIEHQTMSFMVGFSQALMAHECAHQWFGDYITCGSWEDIWLNEGFATFFEWLVVERVDRNNWNTGLPSIIRDITSQPGGSVRCDDTTQVGRIFNGRLSYSKGAFLLRMLRWKLGDQIFFNTLKTYLQDPALKNGYAKTPQLIKHFETGSGKDLSVFFDQWYYKQGYPSYRVFWSQSGSEVSFTVTQTQSHASVSFFEMPVALKFVGQNSDTAVIFDHLYSGQSMSFRVSFPVSRLYFDPELKLLSGQNTVVRLKNSDLIVYPNPAGKSVYVFGLPGGTVLYHYFISDMFGRIVGSESFTKIISDELEIDVNFLPKGVYNITLNTSEGRSHLRLLKD